MNRRRWFTASGAALWITAAFGYLLLEAIAAAGFQPSYSYAHDYISDLGVTPQSPRAHLMNTAFYLQGILFFAGAALVSRGCGSRKRGLFLGLAATNALGNILVGTAHSGPVAQADGTSWLHVTGASLAIVGGNAAIVAGSSLVRNAGGSQRYRAVSIVLAAMGFLSLLMLLVDSSSTADGLWERGSVYSILVWQIFTAVYLLIMGRRRPG